MKFHLVLQYRRACRIIEQLGFPLWSIVSLLLVSFLAGGRVLISRLDYGPLLFLIIGVMLVVPLFSKSRSQFYKSIYSNRDYFLIRWVESVIVSIPFISLLVLYGPWQKGVLMALISTVLPIVEFFMGTSLLKSKVSLPVLPTPFKKIPFEMIVGFRSAWPVFMGIIFITIQAVRVDNYNLGIATLIISCAIMLFFYSKPEPKYYVWVHHFTTGQFILMKLKQATVGGATLVLPQCIILCMFFPQMIHITLLSLLLGMLYIVIGVLGKYAYFPNEMNVIQSLSVALCLLMPPLLIVAIPVFWKKANENLNTLLS